MEPFLEEPNQKIQNALTHLQQEFAGIRAGRANPALIENIIVNAYGVQMKLMEVGTISTPQPSLLHISVWDPAVVKDVEKAIFEANIGINPSIDGQNVRLPIPPLTEERRQEFVKLAHIKGEEARVGIRQIRQEERAKWEKESKDGNYGEDELIRREKILQEIVDKSSGEIDELIKAKEEQLSQI